MYNHRRSNLGFSSKIRRHITLGAPPPPRMKFATTTNLATTAAKAVEF
jgi:hypothetical protein